METENRLIASYSWLGTWRVCANGCRFSSRGSKMFYSLIMVMVAQPQEYTKTTDLYILYRWSLWYLSCISIKQFFKNKTMQSSLSLSSFLERDRKKVNFSEITLNNVVVIYKATHRR
jgi:hypothetical protein